MFVPLHRLWVGYMSELLGLASAAPVDSSLSSKIAPAVVAGMHAKLVKADFHGSIMTGTFCFCLGRGEFDRMRYI